MRHAMMLVTQNQWDEIWNKTPPMLRLLIKSPFGPAFRIATTYADVIVISCGLSEVIVPEKALGFIDETVKHRKMDMFYAKG